MTHRQPRRLRPGTALIATLSLAALALTTTGPRGAATVYASRLAGIHGAAASSIQVQNLDLKQAATVLADFYSYSSRASRPIQVSRPSVMPGGAVNIYMPGVTELRNDLYAMIASADRPIAAIARTDWTTSRAAALYSSVVPGTDVYLPLAVIRYYGQTSLVAIQNTDTGQAASINVALMANGEATPAAERIYTIQPGSGVALDLAAEFADVKANTPGGFLGSLRVISPVPVGMMSFVDIATSQKAVYAFEGGPASAGGKTLYAPLVRSRQRAGGSREYSTGIAVANPGASAVNVTVTYRGSYKTCAGKTYRDGPLMIPAASSAVFYQPASKSLPSDCVATAVIEADGDVFAIVNDAFNLTELAAAYNAVPASQGATLVHLPLVRRQHTALKFTTGIQVMNIGDAVANVEVRFFDDGGIALSLCGAACKSSVPSLAAKVFYPGSEVNGMPAGSYGSAQVTSDQPVVVIVNDASETGAADMATYNGIKGLVEAVPSDPAIPTPTPANAYVTFVARQWVKPNGP